MPDVVKQCKSCPWRVDCDPDDDIPQYSRDMHEKLSCTIVEGMRTGPLHWMACHYSKEGAEFPCAGWLANQLGPGNNIGLRLAAIGGRIPRFEVDGPQVATFKETLRQKR